MYPSVTISSLFAQATPASPSEASTLPSCDMGSDFFSLPKECGSAVALSDRKGRSIALHLIIAADRPVHQQTRSRTGQAELDGFHARPTEQIRTVVERDSDVSTLAGAVGTSLPHSDEPDKPIAPAQTLICRDGRI